jgi:spore maturation protein CgeB
MIVGGTEGTAVAASLARAARTGGQPVELIDSSAAFGRGMVQKLLWWGGGRRPQHLRRLSATVVEAARGQRPSAVIATGLAPLDAAALVALRRMRVRLGCFLTDDPANPAHAAGWFRDALGAYDHVFTPRPWTSAELRAAGARDVVPLRFGFDPALCHPGDAIEPDGAADVLFVGTGDRDRVPILAALRDAGHAVALYGRYYDRWWPTRGLSRGQADAHEVRRQTAAARVSLCLVRKANRDGHVMRSIEMAACGACMLVEDTADHRDLFGRDGECVRYFDGVPALLSVLAELLADPAQRMRLRRAVLARIVAGGHTWGDRLGAMLGVLRA